MSSAASYSNLYSVKYCKSFNKTNTNTCTYGTNCVNTNITTKESSGTVNLESNQINLKADAISLNDIKISGNEISSDNNIKLIANDLDISVNDNLNLYSSNSIDISSNKLDISCTDVINIDCKTLDILQSNSIDISSNKLEISVNEVVVTMYKNTFKFQKVGDKIFIIHNNLLSFPTSKNYIVDGTDGGSACSIM